jgi:hypothetical protein
MVFEIKNNISDFTAQKEREVINVWKKTIAEPQ